MKKLAALVVLMLLLWSTACADMTVHFLDVGHGDCAIIECDDHAMIIDGGNSGCSDLVYAYLKEHDITRLDYAIASHPDADHIGGLPAAFHAADVSFLYSPVLEHDTQRFEKLMQTAEDKGVPVVIPVPGEVLELGEATATILSPITPCSDANEMSIVILLEYGHNKFLFCADAGEKTEKHLRETYPNLRADVVKIAHHGSGSASQMQFVLAVSPMYAVISGNERYNNPDEEVVTKWLAGKAHLLHTKQNGHIVMHSDGSAITVDNFSPYIGNRNSGVVHYAHCESVEIMKKTNKVQFFTLEEAFFHQYRPCKNCRPE
jgi:competence protein ComEC